MEFRGKRKLDFGSMFARWPSMAKLAALLYVIAVALLLVILWREVLSIQDIALKAGHEGRPTPGLASASPSDTREILVLNSYHPGYSWSDNEMAGVVETIRNADVNIKIRIEYLDCKNYPGLEHFGRLSELFVKKYRGRNFPVVLVTDNPAMQFALAYRRLLFPRSAIVFCGINGFDRNMLKGQENITGVAELLDADDTVALALKLHPKTREIIVVHDYTSTGLATRRETEAQLKPYADRIPVRYMENLSTADLVAFVKGLAPDSLVLALSYSLDKAGQVINHEKIASMLGGNSPVPVYGLHEERIGYGIVGGYLMGGRHHASRAAEMALKIMSGQTASSVPLDLKSPTTLMFDHIQMTRFGITRNMLPPGAIIVNEPISFISTYPRVVITAVLLFILLSSGLVVLVSNMVRRETAEQELRQSEERYRSLFENQHAVMLIVDPETTRILDANPAACTYYGYNLEQMRSLKIMDINTASAEAISRDAVAAAAKIKDRFEFRHRLANNEYRDVEVFTGPILLMGKKVLYSIIHDITERKRAEEALLQKTDELDRFFNVAIDLLCIADTQGRFRRLNPAWERTLGYTVDELKQGHFLDFVHPDDLPATTEAVSILESQNEVVNFVNRYRCKDGTYRWIEWRSVPAGNLIYAAARDITERKKTERQIQHSESRLKTLYNISQYGARDARDLLDFALHEIIGLSESAIGYIYFYDEAKQEFTLNSWSREVMKECSIVEKKSCYELAKTGIWGEAVRQRKPIILNDFSSDHTLKKGYPEGHVQLKKFLTVPVFRNDRIIAVAAVANKVEDYTEDDVRELTIVMDAVWSIVERKDADVKLISYAAALERSNRELEQFAYVASHDLQEPLRKVAGFSELLANRYRGKLDEKADGYIEYITDGAKRMSALINDLLSYSRVMTRGKEFTVVDAGGMLRQVIQDLELMITEQNAVVTSDPLPTVIVDQGQFGQLLQNLVSNGIKYHREEPPKVQVSAEREQNAWRFVVRDNGIGIAPEHFERIFMIFQRLHTRTEYAGSGIGLAICKKIVERLGGKIWVESVPGKGSTFFFTVPDPALKRGESV